MEQVSRIDCIIADINAIDTNKMGQIKLGSMFTKVYKDSSLLTAMFRESSEYNPTHQDFIEQLVPYASTYDENWKTLLKSYEPIKLFHTWKIIAAANIALCTGIFQGKNAFDPSNNTNFGMEELMHIIGTPALNQYITIAGQKMSDIVCAYISVLDVNVAQKLCESAHAKDFTQTLAKEFVDVIKSEGCF